MQAFSLIASKKIDLDGNLHVQTFQSRKMKFIDSFDKENNYIKIDDEPFLCIHFSGVGLNPVKNHLELTFESLDLWEQNNYD